MAHDVKVQYTTGSSAFVEVANQVAPILDDLESRVSHQRKSPFNHVFLFSSRGSLPFKLALEHIYGKYKFADSFRVVEHALSLENMGYLVEAGGPISSEYAETTAEKIIDALNPVLDSKIRAALDPKRPNFVSDWDEVITGNNVAERFRIYNQLPSLSEVPFGLVSFVTERGKRLVGKNILRFNKHKSKMPNSFKIYDMMMQRRIGWSDNDQMYDDFGLEFPSIALPNAPFIVNYLKRKAIPEFYTKFLESYCKGVANTSLCSIVDNNDTINLSDEALFGVSVAAFISAMGELNSEAFKGKKRILPEGEYSLDPVNGTFINTKKDGEEKVLLMMRDPKSGKQYKNPVLMVRTKNELPSQLAFAMQEFYRTIDDHYAHK